MTYKHEKQMLKKNAFKCTIFKILIYLFEFNGFDNPVTCIILNLQC